MGSYYNNGPSPAEMEPLGLPLCDVCLTNDAENYCHEHHKHYCNDCQCPECAEFEASKDEALREDHADAIREMKREDAE